MQYAEHNRITEYARHKELNKMYAYVTIQHLGVALVGIFIPIYLYTLGFSIQQILLFELLYSGFYVACTPLALRIIKALCIKKSFIYSAPFRILFFLLLIQLPNNTWLFYILPLVLALRFSVFNIAFHYNFLQHADRKSTGSSIASVHMLLSLGSFVAPYLGALVITFFGFDAILYVVIGILVVSLIPLFGTKDTCVIETIDYKKIWKDLVSRNDFYINLSYAGYAIEAQIGRVLWPLFLFIYLKSYESVGLITSISLLVASIAFFLIGRRTDRSDKKKLIKSGVRYYAISWISRGISINPFLVVFSDVFKNITEKMMIIPWSSYSYDLARSRSALEYIATRELNINIVRILTLPLFIILFDFLPVSVAFATSFILAAFMTLLIPQINKVSQMEG